MEMYSHYHVAVARHHRGGHGPAAERAVLYPISGSSVVYAMNYELNKNFNRILSLFQQQVYKKSLEDLCKLAVVTTLSLTMKCVLFKCVK